MTPTQALRHADEELVLVDEDICIADRMLNMEHPDVALELLSQASARLGRLRTAINAAVTANPS